MVSGPLASAVGLRSGSGLFGPGFPVNATLGRAVRLIQMNVGGAIPGETDMATHGGPNKFSFAFAENEPDSPWEPYRISRGYAEEESIVLVFGGEGPRNINQHVRPGSATATQAIMYGLANTIAVIGVNNAYLLAGRHDGGGLPRACPGAQRRRLAAVRRPAVPVRAGAHQVQGLEGGRRGQPASPSTSTRRTTTSRSPSPSPSRTSTWSSRAESASTRCACRPSATVTRPASGSIIPTARPSWPGKGGTSGMSLFMTDEACSAEEAEQALASRGLSDGLPVVPPTKARERDAAGRPGRGPRLGPGAPRDGEPDYPGRRLLLDNRRLPPRRAAGRRRRGPRLPEPGDEPARRANHDRNSGDRADHPCPASRGDRSQLGCQLLGPGNRVNACVGRALR